jgi:hypothetical protein
MRDVVIGSLDVMYSIDDRVIAVDELFFVSE